MKRSLIALALASLLPLSAQAADNDALSYSYIEGVYTNIDGDADGFGLRGSIEFGASNFYGFGSYAQAELDNSNIDVDLSEFGMGYAHGISDRTDLISELAYQNVDVDGFGNADGYRVSVGLRSALSDNFEGLLKANYVDFDNTDSDFSGTAGLQWKWTQTWGMTGEVEFGNGGETYLVGVRASF